MRRIILILGALSLAACNSQSEQGDKLKAGAESRAAAVNQGEPPQLKAGLWRWTISGDSPASVSRMCLDEAVQKRINVMGSQMNAGACQVSTAERTATGWTVRSVCDHTATGGGKSVTEGVVAGDPQSRIVQDMTVTTTGAAAEQMNRAFKIRSEGVLEGACPADWKPGDLEIPGGMRINMLEMAEGAARMQAPPKLPTP